ncbi:uncharacterized protein LOC108735625 [Agrilus planipennis]|uniref:Uncharacterized protein LOC108735625 n=1 Tax=Agrilus planipennis TaxID=224129 RepID=A0A1W4WSP3_AGRPL|nr:uncharacterized protein LOC108735625 [Agrilus planipennis]
MYRSLNNFIEKSGFGDGKACLLRTICEIAEIPFEKRTGLFAEILHILLTPSTTSEEIEDYSDMEYYAAEKLGKQTGNCHVLYSECSFSLVSTFTKLK